MQFRINDSHFAKSEHRLSDFSIDLFNSNPGLWSPCAVQAWRWRFFRAFGWKHLETIIFFQQDTSLPVQCLRRCMLRCRTWETRFQFLFQLHWRKYRIPGKKLVFFTESIQIRLINLTITHLYITFIAHQNHWNRAFSIWQSYHIVNFSLPLWMDWHRAQTYLLPFKTI